MECTRTESNHLRAKVANEPRLQLRKLCVRGVINRLVFIVIEEL